MSANLGLDLSVMVISGVLLIRSLCSLPSSTNLFTLPGGVTVDCSVFEVLFIENSENLEGSFVLSKFKFASDTALVVAVAGSGTEISSSNSIASSSRSPSPDSFALVISFLIFL